MVGCSECKMQIYTLYSAVDREVSGDTGILRYIEINTNTNFIFKPAKYISGDNFMYVCETPTFESFLYFDELPTTTTTNNNNNAKKHKC